MKEDTRGHGRTDGWTSELGGLPSLKREYETREIGERKVAPTTRSSTSSA